MVVSQNQNSRVQPSESSLLYSPLLHFVALALIGFILVKSLDRLGLDYSTVNIGFLAKPQVIHLSETELLALLAEHEIEVSESDRLSGKKLNASQHATIIAAIGELIDDAILYDQGIEEGVALNDALIIDRMMKNIETVADKSACAQESCSAAEMSQLLDEAIEIELFDSDPVIRRRIIQLMEQELRQHEVIGHPSDETLTAYIKANPDQFSQPARLSFTQHFFNTLEEAESFRQGISTKIQTSILPSKMTLASETKIEEQFGGEFARTLTSAAEQKQKTPYSIDSSALVASNTNATELAPIKSAFGYHLVTLHEVRPKRLAELNDVYNRAFIKWLEVEKSQSHRRAVARLRNNYQVRTDELGPVAIARFPALWLQALSGERPDESLVKSTNSFSSLEIATGSGV